MIDLKKYIRDIPDFPKPGIIFKDIAPLLHNPKAFGAAVDELAEKFKGERIDLIASVEARGFIFGAALAYKLKRGLVPVRKKGKLPYKTLSVTYDLEYGQDTLEMHQDAIKNGMRVLIADDLLATGGTTKAVADLVEKMGGQVAGIAFLIELTALKGRDRLKPYRVISLIKDKYC